MVFNVADFRAQISKGKFGGLALTNKFIVRITPPAKVFGGSGFATMQELSFFCSTSTLPGKNINTFDYKPIAYGQTNKMPLSRTNETLTTGFYSDSNYLIMRFFHRWLNYIVQDGGEIWNNRAYREIGYKEDYAATIEVIGYDYDASEKITYTFYEAFPIQVGNIQMGWEQNDTTIQIPVEFTYDDMSIDRTSIGGINRPRTPIGLFTRLAQAASIVGVISTIKRPRNIQDLINTGTTVRTLGRGLGVF